MLDADSRFSLPDIPEEQQDLEVAAWHQPVSILSYEPGTPDRFPAFLETRVYQGSSGQIYPLPFIERISQLAQPRQWQAVHLENAYLRLMILPELGGRIHVALDKASGRDVFYRNNVIKPALVGLAGPWISGGVEFNWPQHHRPGTYLPTDWTIEREADGAVTVWCSDHDPFQRMKGMHGIRLRPNSAVIEARVRLFNRTAVTQTFLWWANVAVRVHDDYQSIFPTDVHYVADHAKRAISTFPRANGRYYGVDYPSRATPEHPDGDRLDWYRNIPVPTSYMCISTQDDFFGGYDHAAGLGFVHVADHRIAPGKKQWTWGNAPFGWAWDRNLTDDDGPYVELMAGVYTDNQPDFSYLAPGETKTFSQFWYPYHELGTVHQANADAAVRLEVREAGFEGTAIDMGVAVTSPHEQLAVALLGPSGETLWSEIADAAPGRPLRRAFELPARLAPQELTLLITEADAPLLSWTPRIDPERPAPEPATELPAPADIASADELYLAGVHLAQYRHATRSPEPYWEELLRRDPLDSRTNVALAQRRLAAGELEAAETLLRLAIGRETRRNPNPATGEAHYLLGIVLDRLGQDDAAYDALSKSAWNAAWRAPAHLALARLDARAGRWQQAFDQASAAQRLDADNLQTACIRAIAARRLGRQELAEQILEDASAIDPLHWWTVDLCGRPVPTDARTLQDVAREYASLGLGDDALRLLDLAVEAAVQRPVIGAGNPLPLLHYERAELLARSGRDAAAVIALSTARTVEGTRAFAASLDDAMVLERVLARDDTDARAHALLGHWLYFHRRYRDAEAQLRRAIELDENDPVVWRGLGLAAFNVEHDPDAAARCYAKARLAAPDDAKLLYEADQLAKRRGIPPAERLAELRRSRALVNSRDDLFVAYAELLVLTGEASTAVAEMAGRRFQPWEGGEGEVLRVWELAHLHAASSHGTDAVATLEAAIDTPQTLGEARHLLANYSHVLLAYGDALDAAGRLDDARAAWTAAATSVGDFTTMASVPYSKMTYFSISAARRLGDESRARALTAGLRGYIEQLRAQTPVVDYFATSLPNTLIFTADLDAEQRALILTLEVEAELADGRDDRAQELLNALREAEPSDAFASTVLASFTSSDDKRFRTAAASA